MNSIVLAIMWNKLNFLNRLGYFCSENPCLIVFTENCDYFAGFGIIHNYVLVLLSLLENLFGFCNF